jgi:hypothetical protein
VSDFSDLIRDAAPLFDGSKIMREAERWFDAARQARDENDSSVKLWQEVADGYIREAVAYEAGCRAVLDNMPADYVKRWAKAHGWDEE